MAKLPSLTYTIHHSTDRLRRQQDYVDQEILTTRKFMMGAVPSYGIWTTTDPADALAGSTDPLVVSVNANSQYTVDVNPGWGIMQSGTWIELKNTVRQISLADPSVGTPNVVFLRYMLTSAMQEPNAFLDPVTPYTMRINDPIDAENTAEESVLIGVATLDTYVGYADSVKQDLVPLAIATIQNVTVGGSTTAQLTIDHTRASYSWNRPWFSVVDLQHRSLVGTGTYSPTNPHQTSANDLTVGDLSMFQLHLDHGVVVVKDKSIAKVPGTRCTSAITTVLVDDAAGTATGFTGGVSYVALPYFPVRVGRVWVTSTNSTLAALHVPQTNRVVFPYEVPPAGETISVYYTRAEALEPPLPGATVFRTNGPTTQELIIAGGSGHTSLGATEETFADADRFPMRYEMFVDADADLLKTPQVVFCYKRLDEISGSADADAITPYGPGRLIVGLAGATHVVGLDVQLKIHGTDTTGATINESFQFTQANWTPITVPSIPLKTSTSVHFGSSVFATIDSIEVVNRDFDGPDSAVMVWMAQTPYSNYDKMADMLHVATVDWDGRSLANVFDKRVVCATLRDELNAAMNAELQELLYTTLAGGNQTVFVDDFRRPRYHSLETEDELNENAAHYPTYQFSKQQVGLHGYYRSVGFPVTTGSGTVWQVSMFGTERLVDPWFSHQPTLLSYEGGAWVSYLMTAVPGIPNTWTATTAAVPTRVQVQLYPGQCNGMALYG